MAKVFYFKNILYFLKHLIYLKKILKKPEMKKNNEIFF